jgi:predicted phosphohydrolase
VEAKVLRAADGLNPGTKPLFHRNGSFWKPTSHCSKAAYERGRKALNGTHIMHNALWGVRGFDVQQSVRFLYIYIVTYIYIGI